VSSRAIDAVIFDLDNTLTDFMRAKEESIRAAALAMVDAGLNQDPEDVAERIFAIYRDRGIEHQRVFNLFLEETLGQVEDHILAAAVVAYRRARDGSLVLYPHAKFVLNLLLKQGYKLAVVSDAPRFEAWVRLVYLGLQHTFDLVLTFDDTGHRKPDPEPFRMALERLETSPDRAVIIGDWKERDIAGGHNAGLHTVYARYGDQYSKYSDKSAAPEAEPDFTVDNLLQLLDVLDQLNGTAGGEA